MYPLLRAAALSCLESVLTADLTAYASDAPLNENWSIKFAPVAWFVALDRSGGHSRECVHATVAIAARLIAIRETV